MVVGKTYAAFAGVDGGGISSFGGINITATLASSNLGKMVLGTATSVTLSVRTGGAHNKTLGYVCVD